MALEGQAALVIGGASGIGLAAVRELLREGANVVVCDVSSAVGEVVTRKLQNEYNSQHCFFVNVDVRDDTSLEAGFTAAKDRFGRLDIVVNSAGVLNDFDWNLEVDVNFKGMIRGVLLAWKHMGKQEGESGGVVVNVASILGLVPSAVLPIYTATKHALVGLGRACGSQLHEERTGVRVITVCPGQTDTPMVVPSSHPQLLFEDLAKQRDEEIASYDTQKPENVANAILHVIRQGNSGSLWVSESDEPAYEVVIPERQDMRITRLAPNTVFQNTS